VRVTTTGYRSLSATASFTVIVNEVNTAPVIAAIPDQTVDELTTLVVNVSATDADLPANQLTYQLLEPPSGAVIDGSGRLTWTPTEAQGPSTNVVQVRVTDNGYRS